MEYNLKEKGGIIYRLIKDIDPCFSTQPKGALWGECSNFYYYRKILPAIRNHHQLFTVGLEECTSSATPPPLGSGAGEINYSLLLFLGT